MWKTSGIWLATSVAVIAGDLSDTPHPRLWLPRTSEAAIREKLANDPLAGRLHAAAMASAEIILTERTCRYEIPDGRRLLAESRRALQNIMHCGWAWRISGDEKFRLRTIAELEAACAMKDWNPSHFLDTAEMASAVATGYDWLYPTLTPAQRTMCELAIVEKSLKPARELYAKNAHWTKPRNNWAQVCGAGIAMAAAAVAGNDDGLSEELFDRGLKLVERCGELYQPDGMYPEGPGYWHYGTNYHVMLLAACMPLGRSFPVDPVLRKTGDAIMHLTGPTQLPFNFADGHAKPQKISPAQCWLAGHYKDAAQASYVRDLLAKALDEGGAKFTGGSCFPLAVLWLPEEPSGKKPLPNSAIYQGEQSVAVFRTGWSPDAAWFAIKGGTPAASHGHMDVGSFTYDARGTRWIHDLGSENYNLPGYFSTRRWNYFRLQNRSHNTLEIDGKLQDAESAPCPITSSSLTGNPLAATFDLTAAYQGSAGKILRTARFDAGNGSVRIEDEIESPSGEVVWRAITDATCEVKGEQVVLSKKGRQIVLHRVSPAGTWTITDAKPPTPGENQNQNYHAVVLTVPKMPHVSIVVEIRP